MTYQLLQGDCLEVLRGMPDNSVDSIVTDPPYGLGKEPDALKMLTDWIETGHHDVKGRGFMGKEWDAFVPQPQVWHECLRVLKPGGHLLAFAGTRTQDLMTLGLRLAGFEIRDMVAWVYGSGFPKSLDVSKAIDKSAGAEREVVAVAATGAGNAGKMNSQEAGGCAGGIAWDKTFDITAPATDAAKQWDGWGTALKPALEPITLARKPLKGTVAANVLKWHTGALNIDGCRVATTEKLGGGNTSATVDRTGKHEGWQRPWMQDADAVTAAAERSAASVARSESLGRWPANLIHDGSDEVLAGFPDTKSGTISPHHQRTTDGGNGNTHGKMAGVLGASFGDSGSAARFFYCAKTSKTDRSTDNNHPTVKPTDLMRYLCRLITPPCGVILDPYMGSGSTGKAAMLEDFRFIGIERDPEYFRIAEERIQQSFITNYCNDL
jgi:site-specific DNA-methyltransferase (adenine-specific)